jgi:hypothetical protein
LISGGRHGSGIQHGSRRKTRRVINSVGKGNYLWDSGSTFHVHQPPKNLPGQAHEADPDDYDLYTASGEKLVVTHSSYVKSIGESVVTDIDCRILSPVQLLLTGHRFEGWDRTIKITSKSGVICMGRLTADNEFVVSKSEVEKLLGETKRVNICMLAVMGESSDNEPNTDDMILTSAAGIPASPAEDS